MELRILQPNENKTDPLFDSEDCQTLLQIYDDYYPQIGFNLPWVAYLVVKQNQVVGSCGFTGKPTNGKVEIAYWTFKAFEKQGVASFACRALITIARLKDLNIIITAKTAPEHNASTKILEKNKFTFTGIVQDEDIGEAWLWSLQPE